MQTNLYTFVGMYSRALDALANVLNKGWAHAQAQGVSEADMMEWRLAPDMFPLYRQAHVVIDFSKKWIARAAGLEVPGDFTGQTLAEIQAAIAEAKAYLAKVTPEQLAGRDDAALTVAIGPGMEPTMPVGQWVPGFATPNIFFHLSTAYGILRSKGVQVGKRDLFAGGM